MIIENIIISFPAILEKEAFEDGAIPKWGASFLIDKTNKKALKGMEQLIEQGYRKGIKKGFWKADVNKEDLVSGFKNTPLRDGDTAIKQGSKEKGQGYEGRMFFSATGGDKDKDQPGLVGPNGMRMLDAESQLYSGRVVHADIGSYGYKTGGNGIGFWLNNVMITEATHDRLDGKQDAEDAFSGFATDGGGDDDLS